RNAAYRAANIEGQEFASVSQDMSASTRGLATEQQNLTQATDNVNTALQEYLASLSPSERLQAEVAMAQRALNDAVVEFGENSPQAQAAAAEYAAALARQEAAEQGAERAAAQHNQTLQDRVS